MDYQDYGAELVEEAREEFPICPWCQREIDEEPGFSNGEAYHWDCLDSRADGWAENSSGKGSGYVNGY